MICKGSHMQPHHMKLNKTDFLIYRECAHNAWVKVHRPEIYRAKPTSVFDQNVIDTGNEIDVLARELFPGGAVVGRGEFARSMALVKSQYPVIYQPSFETDRFDIACDMLVWNGVTNVYDLYEVKASTNGHDKKPKEKLYAYDIAFQVAVLRESGVPLGEQYLVRLDREYERDGDLDIDLLFTRENFSERASATLATLPTEMAAAYHALQSTTPPVSPCACIYKGRSSHCTTFEFSNPNVPAYSVHDITRIGASKARLREFVDGRILAITDVPGGIELSDNQRAQVRVAKSKRPEIDRSAIESVLDEHRFPLVFFDYETYAAGVPRFDGYHPFDHIPFQFSLDVMESADGSILHHEFLFTDPTRPDDAAIGALKEFMPRGGSIITWNKSFEMQINRRLAERNPADAEFLAHLNTRIVDLMDVFSTGAYTHPDFEGSCSIKAVMPVLVPELSYKVLDIQEGGSASATWNRIATGAATGDSVDAQRHALLQYCALDTQAMWEIWRVLWRLVSPTRESGPDVEFLVGADAPQNHVTA